MYDANNVKKVVFFGIIELRSNGLRLDKPSFFERFHTRVYL